MPLDIARLAKYESSDSVKKYEYIVKIKERMFLPGKGPMAFLSTGLTSMPPPDEEEGANPEDEDASAFCCCCCDCDVEGVAINEGRRCSTGCGAKTKLGRLAPKIAIDG